MKDVGNACFASAFTAPASCVRSAAPGAVSARCEVVSGEKLEVVSGEKLLTACGGRRALCAAIERAIEHRGLATCFSVRVRIEPRSMFWGQVTLADGRLLPAVGMAEMSPDFESHAGQFWPSRRRSRDLSTALSDT